MKWLEAEETILMTMGPITYYFYKPGMWHSEDLTQWKSYNFGIGFHLWQKVSKNALSNSRTLLPLEAKFEDELLFLGGQLANDQIALFC